MTSAGTFPVRILAQVAGNEPHELAVYHVPMPKQPAPQVVVETAVSAQDQAFAEEVERSLIRKHREAIQRIYL